MSAHRRDTVRSAHTRDTVVIGASSGGVQALCELLARLPASLDAAILIVQHRAAVAGRLAAVLGNSTPLPVSAVVERAQLVPGRVFIAAPDTHMVVNGDHVLATRGPRENRARPSINVLFRTAAAQRGSRVIGVLLTGMLDDGVAGLEAVQRCGGIAVVQDPRDAAFSELPENALKALSSDHVVPLRGIAPLLVSLVKQPAPPAPIPREIAAEAELAGPVRSRAAAVEAIGTQVALACPECGGPLWQVGKGAATIFRCHTGHAFSARLLLDGQAEEIEQSLWAAVRALTERSATLVRLAEQAEAQHLHSAPEYRARAREAAHHAERARKFLLELRITRPDEGGESGSDDPSGR